MNKFKYKQKRRAWRCIRPTLYDDDSRYSYEERLQKEKEFKAYSATPPEEATDILYLWERAKLAIERGADVDKVLTWVRFYLRSNSSKNGRLVLSKSYPCYWNNPPEI